MGGKHFTWVGDGPGFTIGRWSCAHTHVQPGEEQGSDQPIINVVLSGAFVRHLGRLQILADPTVALVSDPGEVWRSSHLPGSCGDHGVFALVEPDLRSRAKQGVRPLTGRAWLAWARASRGDLELATALVADVIDGGPLPAREPRFVGRARRWLAAQAVDPPSLEVLSEELRVSAWHLCRTFRAYTGTTPRAYAERIRLVAAMARIEAGAPDLATVALELGFSSHSHMTARCRAVLGATPTEARARS